MRVEEEAHDKYDQPCMIFHSTDINKITEWLQDHYQYYKFAIIIDTMSDEFDYEPSKVTYVYFLDAIAQEVKHYIG